MPTGLAKSLKAFNSKQVSFLHSCKARLCHDINLRPLWCQYFAISQAAQRWTAPRTKVGFSLVNFCLSPLAPNGKKVTTQFYSSHNRFIRLFTMGTRNGTVSIEENPNKGARDAKVQEEEPVKLQKEPDKRQEGEEEQRKRVKEQEIEHKIGPPPEKPLAGDCCGQGCEVCVWDTYWEELDQYRKLRKAAEEGS